MKKLLDLAQENLVNIQDSYGILDQYLLSMDVSYTLESRHGPLSVNQLKNDSYH